MVDCDPGVDDAVSLAWLAAQERAGRCRVELVTTVGGNVAGSQTARNAVQVVEAVGLDCPVEAGCDRPLARPVWQRAGHVHGEDGLCGLAKQDAPEPDGRDGVRALVETARGLAEEAQPPVLLAHGPLTNVAAALAIEPALPTFLDRLVVMGGAFGPAKGNTTPWAEFNFAWDPEAARAVCHGGFPMTLVPLDVTHRVVLTQAELDGLDAERTDPFVLDLLSAMLGRPKGIDAPSGSYVHDALAAIVALDPSIVSCRRLVVDVLTCQPEAGHSIGRERHADDPADIPHVDVATDVDSGRAMTALLDALGAGPGVP